MKFVAIIDPRIAGSGSILTVDETQSLTDYVLLAGRNGGQTINGGTDSGDNLTLVSTAHATKGIIKADGETIRMKRLLAGNVV